MVTKRFAFGCAVALALCAFVAAGASVTADDPPSSSTEARSVASHRGPVWSASWMYGGETIERMTASKVVAAVVRGRVASINDGAPLTTSTADDVAPLPTQRISIAVE